MHVKTKTPVRMLK